MKPVTILLAVFTSGCFACCGNSGPPHYSIGKEPLGGAIQWNGRTVEDVGLYITISPGIDPPEEMVELYEGTSRVALTGEYFPSIDYRQGACPHPEIQYSLSSILDGEYTLVHRRRTAPAGYTTTETAWTVFEGEEALVTTLVVRHAGGADGGP